MTARKRNRGRSRGFSHVSTTLEMAGIMAWFVVLVLGEKYVGDATRARRDAETTAQQTSIATAMSYCEDTSVKLGGDGAQGGVDVRVNGKLDIMQILSIVVGLGIGGQRTYGVYLNELRSTSAAGQKGRVVPHWLIAQGTHSFASKKSIACLERSKDIPKPAIDEYRKSVFDTNIRGYR